MDFAYDATKSVLSLAGDSMWDLRFTKTTLLDEDQNADLGKGSPFQHHHFHVRYLSSRGAGRSFFSRFLFLLFAWIFWLTQDRRESQLRKIPTKISFNLIRTNISWTTALRTSLRFTRRKGMAISCAQQPNPQRATVTMTISKPNLSTGGAPCLFGVSVVKWKFSTDLGCCMKKVIEMKYVNLKMP